MKGRSHARRADVRKRRRAWRHIGDQDSVMDVWLPIAAAEFPPHRGVLPEDFPYAQRPRAMD